MTSQGPVPFLSFNFALYLLGSGKKLGNFSEISGIGFDVEFEEYQEGGINHFIHKLPRVTNNSTIILRNGLGDSDVLFKWHNGVIHGKINFSQISVILLDNKGKALKKWNLSNAFPLKWTCSNFSAESSSIAIETLEIAHQGLIEEF